MPKITKKELLERVQAGEQSSIGGEDRWPAHFIVATAQALGYLVVDEPELPPSLEAWPPPSNQLAFLCKFTLPISWSRDFSEAEVGALTDEIRRRYNAKAKVLAVLTELDGIDGMNLNPRIAARRIRAAYED